MIEQLLEEEKLVLDIVHEYINKNRHFDTNTIIPFINSRFSKSSVNINNNGIKSILQSLIRKNIIIDGSKLTKDNVLLNENRKLIFKYIKKNPGIYFYKLVKELNLTIPVVGWHLNVLLKFKFIRKIKIDNHESYFEENKKSQYNKAIHIITQEKSQKIIQYLIINNNGNTKNHLSVKLGMHSNTIAKYIENFEEYGLIIKKNFPKKILYFLNEDVLKDKFSLYINM